MATPKGILNTGYTIPVIGYATKNLTLSNAESLLKTALSSGCRHLDISMSQSNVEYIGKAVQKILNETNLKREDIFISANCSPQHSSVTENVSAMIRQTLDYFNTSYLDMCMLQNSDTVDHKKIWKEMETLKQEGLINSTGVSDFSEYQIEKLLKECSIVPAMHQIEYTAVSESHVGFCKQNGIVLSAYMPLRLKATSTRSLFDDRSIVREIATRHGKTTTQITLRANFQRGLVSVVEDMSLSQIRHKFQIFDFALSSDEVNAITTLKKKRLQSTTHEFRLIDIIDEKPTKHHRHWRGQRLYSEASEG